MIQNPLTASHQKCEKRMFDGNPRSGRLAWGEGGSRSLCCCWFVVSASTLVRWLSVCRAVSVRVAVLLTFGHHRAACGKVGVLSRRGYAVESAVAQICREGGASQHSDVTVRLFESDSHIQSTLDVGVWKFHSTSCRFHTGCHTQRDRWPRIEDSLKVSREV